MPLRILCVDDNLNVRNFLNEAFRDAGFESCTAQNAAEALRYSAKAGFDVFIVNMSLPGMSGLDLCRELKPSYPEASFFAMTGYPTLSDRGLCRAAGFDDYFIKPFEITSAIQLICQCQEKAS